MDRKAQPLDTANEPEMNDAAFSPEEALGPWPDGVGVEQEPQKRSQNP